MENDTHILVIASLCSNSCRFHRWGKGSEVHKRLPRDLHHPHAGSLAQANLLSIIQQHVSGFGSFYLPVLQKHKVLWESRPSQYWQPGQLQHGQLPARGELGERRSHYGTQGLKGDLNILEGPFRCEVAHARHPGCILSSSMRADAGQRMLPSSLGILPSTVRFIATAHRAASGQQAFVRQFLYIPKLLSQQQRIRHSLRWLQCSASQQDDQARSDASDQQLEGLTGASNALFSGSENDMCDPQGIRSLTKIYSASYTMLKSSSKVPPILPSLCSYCRTPRGLMMGAEMS